MNGAHLHLMLNHAPVIGSVVAVMLLAVVVVRPRRGLAVTALVTCVVVGVVAAMAYLTGEPAEEVIRGVAGVSRSSIESHEEAAMVALGASIGVGVLALLGLVMLRRRSAPTRWLAATMFVFVALTVWYAHPFWTMTGAPRGANQAHALKNLAIMGALLLLMVGRSGRYSIDGMRGRA